MATVPYDLQARARRAVLEAGFQPDFPPEVIEEIQRLAQKAPHDAGPGVRDMRAVLWSSIDNDTSRDLDQVEYVEPLPDGGTRLLVGVAEVDSCAPKGSATDRQAGRQATSVYTGPATFPMLPGELSTDKTSLVEDQDRLSIVIDMRLRDSGEPPAPEVYRAWIRNHAKLAYNSTAAWLEGRGPMPPPIARAPGMEGQLRLQQKTSEKLRACRKQQGALAFDSMEPVPTLINGRVQGLTARQHNVAEDIIEDFMVAANVAIAQYLKNHNTLSLRRVVRTPRRWDRIQAIASRFAVKLPSAPDPRALSEFLDKRRAADPAHFPDLSLVVIKLLGPGEYIVESPGREKEGHFGLAATDYTHSTAPNRRYADLATQRLLKGALAGTDTPYSQGELSTVAAHCTEREDAARKVERLMRKVMAASLLSGRIGEVFDGLVTGASPKGTYARLLNFPAEGRVVRGSNGIDVGDKVRVRLIAVDADRGYIDFEKVDARIP
jgi:exoribonuclease-2